MEAITTQYVGPTNTRGSRVRAKRGEATVTVAWDYALSGSENHAAAAHLLAQAKGWSGRWVGGYTSGRVYVWLPADGDGFGV